MKKIISMLLLISLIIMPYKKIEACEKDVNVSVEDILISYHMQLEEIKKQALNARVSSMDQKKYLQEETVCILQNAGYEAYAINGENFYEIQDALATDLTQLGIKEGELYIAVISGEEENNEKGVSYSAKPSGSFAYSYKGKDYSLRYLTITAADNSAYGKASTVNLLESKSQTVINNCLNTAIIAYISAISSPLGTVASLCGLDISKFNTSQTATLYLNGGTNWTRMYTQVWSDYDEFWFSGSCVDYVTASSYMSGQYYSADKNQYVSVPQDSNTVTEFSSNYDDKSWRHLNAVIGYFNGSTQYDKVGDVEYRYGGVTKITHREDF